jgi:hypothetical protein
MTVVLIHNTQDALQLKNENLDETVAPKGIGEGLTKK